MDLIDRQAAIDALGERPTVWIDDDEYSLGQRNQYDCDKLAIETVPSAQPEPLSDAYMKAVWTWLRIWSLRLSSLPHISAGYGKSYTMARREKKVILND